MAGEQIGFIGLGVMGKPMAKNLLKAGYMLKVHNRSRAPVEELLALGARGASSPKEAAEGTEYIITMLPDSPEVEQVLLGPNGVLEGARPGAVVIDMSTISPAVTRAIAAKLAAKGVEMLDAPVSGGEVGAIKGELSIMVGGKEEVFKRCLPILQVLGRKVTYVGECGMGQTAKLCNQVICVLNIEAVCEGLILGAKAGLDLEKLLAIVTEGAAGSWMLSNLGPKILQGDFTPGFTVRLQQKDLRLALALAEELKVPLPGTSLVNQLFRAVEAAGGGDQGTQALITALERLAGVEARKRHG